MNLIEIAKAWATFAQGTPETKALMERRLSVCDQCPHKTQMDAFGVAMVTAFNNQSSVYKCGICNCPLAVKTSYSFSSCPDAPPRWKSTADENFF